MPTYFALTASAPRPAHDAETAPLDRPTGLDGTSVVAASLDARLAAVLDPWVGPASLAIAFDGVAGDRHPTALLIRATVAARLHVAWLAAGDVVTACRVAHAAAKRVPLPVPVAVLARALGWSPLVRATIGRALRANPDPITALLGARWCRAVDGVPDEEPP
jgi:hypothetical protein